MEQATNLFTKGLLLDTHPMVLSNDTLTDCLNGTLITMNGNEVILQNDMGNRRVDKAFLPPGYEPVGIKEYGGIIYVASYNPITNKSLIGSFPSPLKKLSSNSSGELQEVFDFSSFTSSSNYETDPDLGINVLKSDSVMLPLSNDLSLRAGDKFAVYSSGLSELSEYLTNYNNVYNGKAFSPKNRKYTLLLGVLNSLNEFVDITKTLYRWKNLGTTNNPDWKPVNYSSEVSETFKFNDGYFISNAFLDTFDTNTISDAELIKERQKIAANTYSYKLVGPLYLKISINHIENFNYNIYGIKNNDGTANLWVEGFLTYNCPDGTSAINLNDPNNNSNEDYRTFEEGIPNSDGESNFGFDLIGVTPTNTEIGRSIYNPSTNTYTVKIVKKYTNVAANRDGYMFDYVIGVKVDKDTSGVYLKGLSTKGSINLSLLGSGTLKFIGWKFYNNSAESTTALTFTFNAYPEYGKQFYNLKLRFYAIGSSIPVEYPELLPIYNGKQTITFNWENLGLSKGVVYTVTATYLVTGDNTIHTINDGFTRWFITTDLFNEFYPTSAGIADYCNVDSEAHPEFYNKMVILLENESSITDESSTTESPEGKLVTISNAKISYAYKHTHKIKVTVNPTLKIKNKDLYPSNIGITSARENAVNISSIDLYQIGNVIGPQTENETLTTRTFNNIFRNQLEAIKGRTYDESNQLWNPLSELNNQTFLQETILSTNDKTISGQVEYYDVYKAYGELINNINNAFQKFSQLIPYVKPYNGHFGGVISDFDTHRGSDNDSHYIEVAINLDLDNGHLPDDHDLPTGWREITSEDGDNIKFNIDQYMGSIFQALNESAKDTDITFLYYFCPENCFTTNVNASTGQSGGSYTRVWWMMPNGEWAAFRELYRKTNAANGFSDFIMSSLGGKDLIYCMYDNYAENDKIYAPKESYIYYDKYNIPMVYNINYSLLLGNGISTPSDVVANYRYNNIGNLHFSISNSISFTPDKIEFYLQPSDNFYRDINNVDSENISNVYIDTGESTDSEGRPLNRNYFYYLDRNNGNKLTRIDNSYFYIDTINKTQDGRNRVLYNEHTKGSVSYRHLSSGEDESHTVIIYNSLKTVKPV